MTFANVGMMTMASSISASSTSCWMTRLSKSPQNKTAHRDWLIASRWVIFSRKRICPARSPHQDRQIHPSSGRKYPQSPSPRRGTGKDGSPHS